MLISHILDQIIQGMSNLKRKIRGSGTLARKSTQHDTLRTPSSPTAVVPNFFPVSQTASSKANVDVRKRLVHFLAVETHETDLAVARVCGNNCDATTRSNLLSILEEVAEQAPAPGGKKWSLKDSTWLEVRPYEWETYEPPERINIARRGRLMLSSLNIPESDPVWDHFRFRNLAPPSTGATLYSTNRDNPLVGISQPKLKPKRPTVFIPPRPVFLDDARDAGLARLRANWTQHLVSDTLRSRNGSDIQLREPSIDEVLCTADKPRNVHVRKKPPANSGIQGAPPLPQLTAPTVATASTLHAVAGTVGTT